MPAKPIKVAIVVLQQGTPLVPIGVAEMLKKSSALAQTLPARKARPVEVVLVGESRRTITAGGYPLQCDATFATLRACDVVVVPAIDPDILEGLALNRSAVEWISRMYRSGADVSSACTGAFALAEAGLLDGRRATTHWAFQSLFAERYPRVKLEAQAVLVDTGRVSTAGGATSFINLSLYWVERLLGPEVSFAASKMFLVDVNKAPQGAYAIFSSQKLHHDVEILRAQELIERELAKADSITTLARKVALSGRTFIRRFKQATGNTPREYIQRVRVESAKRALEQSRQSLTEVASRVGYRDGVAFRKVFQRFTGLTPADYRRRYGPYRLPAMVGVHHLTRASSSRTSK